MSVWLTIPSARPPEEANPVLREWKRQGYGIALWRDEYEPHCEPSDFVIAKEGYPGYSRAINILIRELLHARPDSEWFVIGGDDTLPDPNLSAEEIALQCGAHFAELFTNAEGATYPMTCTFGVMQPTGDRFGGGQIDRICGSAWIGREFAQRVNRGNGPLWPEYTHMFPDEELQCVAQKYGVLWQRPDLVQLHKRFDRESDAIDAAPVDRPWPAHVKHDGYTREHWDKYDALFKKRRAEGFPGSELL